MKSDDKFLNAMLSNKLVYKEKDFINFYNSCNLKPDMNIFTEYKNNLSIHNYKNSKSFFGTEFYHPINVNPYRVNYDLTRIMNELKLSSQKIKYDDKLNKLINYVKYLN